MPWNFIIRNLLNFIVYFTLLFPLITSLLNWLLGYTHLTFTNQLIVGPILGLFFGSYQLFNHFRNISELVEEVNEDTVKPVRAYETLLNEKVAPAMETISERLSQKGWNLKEKDTNTGQLSFTVNKHKAVYPYKFEITMLPRHNSKTYLKAVIKAPVFDNYFPDLGRSLQYMKEFKTALL